MKILQVHYPGRGRETQFPKEKNDKNSFEIPCESGKSILASSFAIFQLADLGYLSITVILFAKV